MIRTAIPFGYFFIALSLLAAFAVGIGVFAFGWYRHSRPAKWIGGTLLVLVLAVVASELAFESALEWNPRIASDSEVLGTWTDHSQTITLASNHTFSYEALSRTIRGEWKREEWDLYLVGDSYSTTMGFVRFRGHYRLMTHPPQDPDVWDGDLGLRRQH